MAGAIIIASTLVMEAPCARAASLVPLENYLRSPLEDDQASETGYTAGIKGYLGKVKSVSEVGTYRDDNGTIILNLLTVSKFFDDGRAEEIEMTNLLAHQRIKRVTFSYDDGNRISRIAAQNDARKESRSIDFAYDGRGLLIKVTFLTNGDLTKTVTIENDADGRPKDVLQRRVDGKAESRVAYEYGDQRVVVDYFYDGRYAKGEDKATFTLDDKARPIAIEVVRQRELASDDFAGHYTYRYLPSGGKILHGIEIHPNTRVATECTKDAEYFANGWLNEATLKVVPPGLVCHYGPGSKYEFELDDIGNFKFARSGSEVMELGRKVLRWKYETRYEIEYY